MDYRQFLGITGKLLFIAVAVFSVISLSGCSATQASSLPSPSSPAAVVSSPPVFTPSPSTPAAAPSPSPTPTPSPSLTPTRTPPPSPSASPSPVTIYTPAAAPIKPTADQLEMMNYLLSLVNKDRQAKGLSPVVLNFNAAAQQHAQDMLDNRYAAHWATDGLKPYMRYTAAGGLNKEGENSDYLSTGAPKIDVKAELQAFETDMMAEIPPGDSHRQNILNKWHKKVNIGVAYNNNSIALVQQFEGDYIEYYQPPTITGSVLSLNGRFTQPGIVLNNVAVTFDDLPQKLTGQQLMDGPYHSYGPGKILGQVFPPAPPGSAYNSLPANSVIGTSGTFDKSGQFSLQADISSFLAAGKGVYNIVLVAQSGTETTPFTNYSIFIK